MTSVFIRDEQNGAEEASCMVLSSARLLPRRASIYSMYKLQRSYKDVPSEWQYSVVHNVRPAGPRYIVS